MTRAKNHARVTTAAAIGLTVAFAALLGRVGADSRWLAALGHMIAVNGSVPHGVPFAAAPSAGWANPLVLAELIFAGINGALGDRGLMLAQLLAVGAGLAVLARDARSAGAPSGAIAATIVIAGLGTLPSLAIARMQMFSLVLFPVLVALLRSEARRPSARIWLVVPLLALWSNLHGAAILGLGLVFVYLLLARMRSQPLLACAVGAAATAAMFLNPALLGTAGYYHGLLTNVAAQQGDGMWGPLSLTAPFDLILVACGAVLVVCAVRGRLRAWELAVAGALVIMTVTAHRNGVWLLFFLVPPAAAGWSRAPAWGRTAAIVAALSAAVICMAIVRGPVGYAPGAPLIARAVALSAGSPVLAGGGIDEQVAVAGGRIWAGDPLDAFSRADQSAYLAWLAGQPAGHVALARVRVVLVARGTPSARLTASDPGFVAVAGDQAGMLFRRVGG